MANKRKHVGIIRHTIPEPTVFYGSPDECADHMKVTRRQLSYMLTGFTKTNRKGWKIMTEEEFNLHYQPPKPPKSFHSVGKRTGDDCRSNWKITIFKDWVVGDTPPKESDRKFLGTLREMAIFLGCTSSQLSRLVSTKLGEDIPHGLKSYKGWRIYRINKYRKRKIIKKRVWDKELKKMVYKREGG